MLTLAEISDKLSALLGRRDLTIREIENWWNGTVNGGPNGDGLYPATDSTGHVTMLPCVARIRAEAMTPVMVDLTGANAYTLNASHSGRILNVYNNGNATVTVTLPAGLGKGFNCILVWEGTHTTMNLAVGSGASFLQDQSLINNSNQIQPRARGSVVSVICPIANQFLVSGSLRTP